MSSASRPFSSRGEQPRELASGGPAHPREVDQRHRRQRPVVHADRQRECPVAPAARVLQGLERRGGRAEDQHRVLALGADHREVAGVVGGAVLLLEARVVLLVDHQHGQILHRGEDGAADAHADARLAAAQAQPLGVTLRAREAGVEERHLVAAEKLFLNID